MSYDVVVVGAGPAGSATAKGIAAHGFKVLLVEEHDRVGEPSFCSGLVTPRTLQIAESPQRIVLNSVTGAMVHSASGRELALGGDRVHVLAIDRVAFDQDLAERAQQAGAELLLRSRLLHIERRNSHLGLKLESAGKPLDLDTRLLVGADGANSLVAHWMNGPRQCQAETVRAMGVDATLKPQARDRIDILVAKSVAPGWFGWIIPLGDDVVRVGVGDGNGGSKPLQHTLQDLVAAFPALFHGAKFGRPRGHVLPLYASTKTYADNVILVGDAARQVKPTSGGGLYVGLVGAKHCARTAIDALEREDFSGAFLSRYEASWKSELGTELERAADLRRIFLSLSDQEIDGLLNILGAAPLRNLINQFGDVDFQSSLFGQLVKALPFLSHFARIPLRLSAHWGG